MKWLDTLLKILGTVGTYLVGYMYSNKSTEANKLRDINNMLKKYSKIDNKEISHDELYSKDNWK